MANADGMAGGFPSILTKAELDQLESELSSRPVPKPAPEGAFAVDRDVAQSLVQRMARLRDGLGEASQELNLQQRSARLEGYARAAFQRGK